MSDLPADSKKARNQQLQGQASEESASRVHAQREFKKLEKQTRKIASQIKAATKEGKPTPTPAAPPVAPWLPAAPLPGSCGQDLSPSAEGDDAAGGVQLALWPPLPHDDTDADDEPELLLLHSLTKHSAVTPAASSPPPANATADATATKLARIRQLEEELEALRREVGGPAAAAAPATPPPVAARPLPAVQSPGLAARLAGGVPPRMQLDLVSLRAGRSQQAVACTPLPTPAHSDIAASDISRKSSRRRNASSVVNVFAASRADEPDASSHSAASLPSAPSCTPLLTIPHNVASYPDVFPRIAELGLLYQTMQIVGCNARTIALLDAIIAISQEMTLLDTGVFTQHVLQEYLSIVDRNCRFLNTCREHSYGQQYVMRKLRLRIARNCTCMADLVHGGGMGTPPNIDTPSVSSPASQRAPAAFGSHRGTSLLGGGEHGSSGGPAGQTAGDGLDGCRLASDTTPVPEVYNVREAVVKELVDIREELYRAVHCIVEERSPLVFQTRDVILVCGRSSTIEQVLLRAAYRVPAMQHTPFHVIVVDCAPLFEGRDFAWRLQQAGIAVTYGLLSSICMLIPKCTKVFIGASAVLQSGEVHGRCGTALVAATAKRFRKPVLCFAESYKFISKVWIGSLIRNQDAGNVLSRKLVDTSSSSDAAGTASGGWGGTATSGTVLVRAPVPAVANAVHGRGYLYDLCPAEFIDMIVSEMGCLHPSAIAAAIRDREDREKDLA